MKMSINTSWTYIVRRTWLIEYKEGANFYYCIYVIDYSIFEVIPLTSSLFNELFIFYCYSIYDALINQR